MRTVQVCRRELLVGMDVHHEPLAGVEQLDQHAEVGAVPGHVLDTQPVHGVGLDRVPQDAPVRQPGQALVGLAEAGGGRADPVLGHVRRPRRQAAQRLDAPSALVEVRELVRGQSEERHLGSVPSGRSADQPEGGVGVAVPL